MPTRKKKVPVTKQAVIQRINRRLAHDGEQLKTTRGNRWRSDLGDHFLVALIRGDVDLDELARELDALAPWERVEE